MIIITVILVVAWFVVCSICGRITAKGGRSKIVGWLLWMCLSWIGLVICVILLSRPPKPPKGPWGLPMPKSQGGTGPEFRRAPPGFGGGDDVRGPGQP
jgi:hypothetical protein